MLKALGRFVKTTKLRVKFLLSILTFMSTLHLQAKTDWTVLTYVQANNNLYGFSLKNFSDMAAIGSNENVTMLVQWFQPQNKGVWRYRVTKGKLELDECRPAENSTGTSAEELVDSMQWAVNKYPANKYSLILWDHGIGCLDPQWSGYRPHKASDRLIDPAMVALSARIQIPGLTTNVTHMIEDTINDAAVMIGEHLIQNPIAMIKATEIADSVAGALDTMITSTRGILFNEHTKTYMDNQTLVNALSTIKTKVLNNKKIDLLGMDACLMAMVEVGYQTRDYAQILVGSQEVELANGWNYLALMQTLSNKNISAQQASQEIVTAFETYYKDKIPFHTQSAINLDGMNDLKTSIDAFVTSFKACQQSDRNLMKSLTRTARQSTLQFSSPGYVDLHSFYTELFKQISQALPSSSPLAQSSLITDLKQRVTAGMKTIEQFVIASTAGKNLSRARGLSIYFPGAGAIDQSYPKTDFARDCMWHGFIREFIGG